MTDGGMTDDETIETDGEGTGKEMGTGGGTTGLAEGGIGMREIEGTKGGTETALTGLALTKMIGETKILTALQGPKSPRNPNLQLQQLAPASK